MNVSPFLLLKNSTLLAINEQLNTSIKKWAAEWKVSAENSGNCFPAIQFQATLFTEDNWDIRSLENGSSVWIKTGDGLHRYLEQAIFGLQSMDATSEKNASSPLAMQVVDDAVAELIDSMIGNITQQEILSETAFFQPPAQLFKSGSGAVVCTVYLGAKALWILLPEAALLRFKKFRIASSSSKLLPLHKALKDIRVSLAVEVSGAELTIGYLGTLEIGDVLKLPTSLEQSLRVAMPDDTTVCHAHLGIASGSLAVELVKA
ncbi:FliM/FliN family flagellar motor switch protein [Undibacterium sp. TJN19]|uniref:FliM/FliN family flagellar motor switch protein n=1 Tax=Undibacterium sp. TJN19 TaxID=3413055 RepID=UPI003BF17569